MENTNVKTKKSILKRWWFWVIAVIVVIAVATNLNQEDSKNTPVNSQANGTDQAQSSDSKKEDKKEDKEVAITKPGEQIQTKNFKISVEALNKLKGDEFNKPGDGKEFVEVVLLIENISTKDYSVSSLLMFDAYQDGFSTNESISAQVANSDINTLDGSLAAGKKMKGKLAYELPLDWKELEINVDLTKLSLLSTDGEVKIILKNE